MNRRKVLVTGGNGFIGSNLVKALQKCKDIDTIYVLTRKQSTNLHLPRGSRVRSVIYDGTMKSLDVVKDVDTVYHLAALYSTKTDRATVEDLVTSNIIFSLNIIHSIIEKNPKCKFVSTSTFSSFDENYNYAPASFYAATKTAVEILAQTYPVSTTFLRLPDTYGTDDWRPKVHNLLRDAVRHKEKSFTFMKPGEQVMNLIHVEDVVRALLHSADLLRGNTVTKTVYDLFYPENAMELGELGDYLIKGSQTHLVFPLFGRIDPVPPQKHVLPEFELLHSPHIDLAETLLK